MGMNQHTSHTKFFALDHALSMVRAIRPLAEKLGRHDSGLHKQLRAAASSVPLNLAEGQRLTKGNRIHHYRIAMGSADETRTCLHVAEAWGYLEQDELTEVLDLLDQIVAICWRLTH
jgi:four helix bundle protein